MKNELQKHKLSDKIKWILTGFAFVLVFAVLAGLCMQLFAKDDKYKPSNWFAPIEQVQPDSGENELAALPSNRAMAKTMSASVGENDEITTYSDIVSLPSWYDPYSTKALVRVAYASGYLNYYTNVSLGSKELDDKSSVTVYYCITGTSFEVFCMVNVKPQPYTLGSVTVDIFCEENVGGVTGIRVWSPDSLIECYEYTSTCYISDVFVVPLWAFNGSTTANDDVKIDITLNISYLPNTYPLPDAPVKEGYIFLGWYMGADEDCDGECVEYIENVIYEDTELHAHFAINEYTVSFNSAGGNTVENITVEWGAVLTPETPKKVGYTFLGWYCSDGTKYENQPITSNIVLTAHWEVKMCTVTFYVNGEVYETKQVEWGSVLSGVTDMASGLNLQVMTIRVADNGQSTESLNNATVMTDLDVTAIFMDGADKVVNVVKNNKWQVVAGVAGGIALIAVIAAACSGKKRKSK